MSDKLDMKSPDLVNTNFEKLAALFPNCVTEGPDGKAIDFDLLKQELSHAVVDGTKERYRLEWPGKREAIVTANLPTTKTLRPVREDSVDFDNTENLYIEGDNLEVLKLLQESYLGKIKMIYIDPPYNTGNDFVYLDDFTKHSKVSNVESGLVDTDGTKLVGLKDNPATEARFHSDWLSMIYPRLKLARNLMRNDGLIFISIDENEIHNLRKICDEIFGQDQMVANIIWQSRTSISNDQLISLNHNHTLIYAKNITSLVFGGERLDLNDYKNPDNDPRGPWKLVPIDANKAGGNTKYPIKNPKTGVVYYPPNGRIWAFNEKEYERLLDDGRIKFGITDDSSPKRKLYYKERLAKGDFKTPSSILLDAGTTKHGTTEIMNLFDNKKVFSYPKPTRLIRRFLDYGLVRNDDIVLDFFSGSATTADAVLQANASDAVKRKFILVQLQERLNDKAIEHKGAYEFCKSEQLPVLLTEPAKERIRRAAKKIKEETGADIDYGFRVYRLDSSNMRDVYYKPQDYSQDNLDLFADNVKPDRTPDDLLAQIMLDWGLPLSLKIEQVTISGKQVFKVAGDSLFACFDTEIDEAFAKEIAKEKPLRIVFCDSGFKNDTAKTNVKQLLKQLSPETEMKVI